jgi:GntR family transcriptional regulator
VAETIGVPLYRQIQADLRDRIQRGDLAPGDRLETEQELMARYEVSRATVRQALGGLVNDGLVEIRRGLGTYVRRGAMEHRLGGFYSYSREIERHGLRPGTRVRGLRVEPAGKHVAAALELEPGEPVVALARIRLADDEALVTETSYLPAARFPGLERIDFRQRSLYDTLTSQFDVRPLRARETFEPVLLSAEEAAQLGVVPGGPALRVERTTFDGDGNVIEYCRSTVRADRYHYSVELGGG